MTFFRGNLYIFVRFTGTLLDRVVFRDGEDENILFGVEDSVLREEDSLDSIANIQDEEASQHGWIDEEKIRQSRMNAATPITIKNKKENSAPSNLKSENRKLKERVAYLSRLGKRNTKRLSSQARIGAEMKSLRTETEQLREMLDSRDVEVTELKRQVQALSIENKNNNVNKEEYDNLLLEHTRLRSESTTRKKTHDILYVVFERFCQVRIISQLYHSSNTMHTRVKQRSRTDPIE